MFFSRVELSNALIGFDFKLISFRMFLGFGDHVFFLCLFVFAALFDVQVTGVALRICFPEKTYNKIFLSSRFY